MFSRITVSVEDTEKITCNHSFKLIISNGVRLFFVIEWASSAKHLCFPPSYLKKTTKQKQQQTKQKKTSESLGAT